MIKLGDKEYKLGMNLHVRLMYESITGKIYGDRMLEFDWVVLLYCVLLRSMMISKERISKNSLICWLKMRHRIMNF